MAPYCVEDDNLCDASSGSKDPKENTVELGEVESCFLPPGEEFRLGTIDLNLAKNYLTDWTEYDAFREIFQNWRDGIIENSGIEHKNLQFNVVGERGRQYIVEVTPVHGNSGKEKRYLGYIRYSKDTNMLEVTNFGAKLKRSNVTFGGSSKAGKRNLAGAHGEGLKVASLVMVRNGHSVKYEASSVYLNFDFLSNHPDEFVCKVTKPVHTVIRKKEDKYEKRGPVGYFSTRLESNVYGDVTAKIGNIKFTDFTEWLKVSLDIERPSSIIDTGDGSIIFDPEFGGRIYLKGLLLQTHPSVGNKPEDASIKRFKFGYDLPEGKTERDRRSMTDPNEVARLIAKIWGKAILTDAADNMSTGETIKPVKHYVDMLREEEEDLWADVQHAKRHIKFDVAKKIWRYLREEALVREIFYHDHKNVERDGDIIKRSLKREPVQLAASIWETLRKHKMIRSPQEEERSLLRNAPDSAKDDRPYSLAVQRALGAALELDVRTKGLKLSFKSGEEVELDLLLDKPDGSDESILLIHDRWRDFEACHKRSACSLSYRNSAKDYNTEPFSCDHVVNYLYGLVLDQLKLGSIYGGEIAADSSLRTKVSEILLEMPRKIEISQGSQPGEIRVSWVDIASAKASKLQGLDLKCKITLHCERRCSERREELLSSQSITDDEAQILEIGSQREAECGCQEIIEYQKDQETCFTGLQLVDDLGRVKYYFPMVACMNSQAFYSLPPKALHPRQDEDRNSSDLHMRTILPLREIQPNPSDCDSSVDTPNPSSGTEKDVEVDSPQTTPSPQRPENMTIPIQPIDGTLSSGTPRQFGVHGSQSPRRPNRTSQGEIGQGIARLQAGNGTQSERLNFAREQIQMLVRDLETRVQSQSPPRELGASERSISGNARDCRDERVDSVAKYRQHESSHSVVRTVFAENEQPRTEIERLNAKNIQMGATFQVLLVENQSLVQEQEAQREALQNYDNKCQDNRFQIGGFQRAHEVEDASFESTDSGSASQTWCPEDVGAVIEDLRDRIKQLEAQVQQLQNENAELKTKSETSEAALQMTLQRIRHVQEHITSPRSIRQLPNMVGQPASAEPGESTSWTERKRRNPDEQGESSERAGKRYKTGEFVDVSGSVFVNDMEGFCNNV